MKGAYEMDGCKVFCIDEVDETAMKSEKEAIQMASALEVSNLIRGWT